MRLKGVSTMIIIGTVKADVAGRVSITKLFNTIPQKVLVTYDTDRKRVVVFNSEEVKSKCRIADLRTPDEKGRVCFPKWILETLGEEYLVTDASIQGHFLIPKKHFTL